MVSCWVGKTQLPVRRNVTFRARSNKRAIGSSLRCLSLESSSLVTPCDWSFEAKSFVCFSATNHRTLQALIWLRRSSWDASHLPGMSSVRCGWVASRVGRYLVDPGSEAFVAGRLAWWKSWAIRGFSSASETVPAARTVAPGVTLFPPNRLRFHYENVLRNDLLAKFDYNNVMEVPRVTAVVVVPRAPLDCEKAARVALEVVCGQKFLPIKSKDPALKVRRSKYEPKRNLRKVVPVARTTLRGDLMYNFLEKLVSVTSFHDYSSNIQSHCVQLRVGSQLLRLFPEILNHIEMFDQIRGVNVTVVTSARTREEAASLWSGFLHREK